MEAIGANNEAMSRIKRGRLPEQRKQGVNNKTASIDLFIRPAAGGSQGPAAGFRVAAKPAPKVTWALFLVHPALKTPP
jgi:hypothetical protein